MKTAILLLLSAFLIVSCSSRPKQHHYKEKHYQTVLCDDLDGKIEVVLKDKTRVDCLTDEYAIEVDFGKKWAESVGQSIYYGLMTDRKPAVGLIISKKETRYLKRLEKVAGELGIKIYVIEKEER